jgi:hypothetical protein
LGLAFVLAQGVAVLGFAEFGWMSLRGMTPQRA